MRTWARWKPLHRATGLKRGAALCKGCAVLVICTLPFWAGAQSVREAWVRRYNGPGNGCDEAFALAVDRLGNVYVTGWSDPDNDPYNYNNDYATVKYDANGNQLWVARYNGPGDGSDAAYALAVDCHGNAYVTGSSWGALGTWYDYATIKYDVYGNELWVRRYNGPGDREDVAYALAVDSQGNVYVTGTSWGGSATFGDYATVKYDAHGNELWVRRYNGPRRGWDVAHALVVDSQGNVYVTGESEGAATGRDYATVKYDSNGNQLWVARYSGPGNDWDVARALAVDSQDNVYVTGYSMGAGPGADYATVKYDTNGNQLWLAHYNGPGNADDGARALAVDGQGNVYVTGFSMGGGTGGDYATVKYDANGTQLWVRHYNGPGNGWDEAIALAVDRLGNVYVTGRSDPDNHPDNYNDDYATVKYELCPGLCPADVNGDGIVNDADLLKVLFAFGRRGSNLGRVDVNCDGRVDDADLLIVRFNFGQGC